MKIRHLRSHTATLALALLAGSIAHATDVSDIVPAAGDKLKLFKQVGEWSVYADANRGSCLMERSDDVGNAMQLGLVKDQSATYVGVFTQADVKVDPSQPIAIVVDGAVFTGESHGIRSGQLSGKWSGGYVLSQDPDFVTAIAEGRELVAFPENPGLFVVDLTGTKRAIDEVRKCHLSLDG